MTLADKFLDLFYIFAENHAWQFKVIYIVIMVIPTQCIFWINYVNYRRKNKD